MSGRHNLSSSGWPAGGSKPLRWASWDAGAFSGRSSTETRTVLALELDSDAGPSPPPQDRGTTSVPGSQRAIQHKAANKRRDTEGKCRPIHLALE